jgi:hypothetical protein
MIVIPAHAGIQEYHRHQAFWIPACAGMTVVLGLLIRTYVMPFGLVMMTPG